MLLGSVPMGPALSATVRAADTETSTTWPWLGEAERAINEFFDPIATAVSSVIFYAPTIGGTSVPLIVFWLVAAAAIFTLYFRGIQFRGFKTSIDLVKGKYSRASDPGEVTHFQALSSACRARSGSGTSPASVWRSRSAGRAPRSG